MASAASALEKQCTLLINVDVASVLGSKGGDKSAVATGGVDLQELRKALESQDMATKMDGLKKILLLHLNGEKMDSMLMSVIRYVLPHEDAHMRKLGLYFLETVDKKGPDGNMLPEMILVVNMIRNDLVHPNEYTRGCALRFCCKLNDAQLLEPLVPSIRQNLEHRHSYVRRNAVLAVHYVFKQFEFLVPDAPELLEEFLRNEGDLSCKRNALTMLMDCDRDRAVLYLHENIQQVPLWSETMQLCSLELIKQVCRQNPAEKGKYMQVIFALLNASSAAVVYQSAMTLISMSSAPTAVRASAQCFCMLLASQSDQNVKLILLDRLLELRKGYAHVLQELVMDVLRALTTPNMDIRRKCLSLVTSLVTNRNVDDVVEALKKELVKTQAEMSMGGSRTGSVASDAVTAAARSAETAVADAYRQLLVKTVHGISLKFKSVVPVVLNILADFLSGVLGAGSSADVVVFMREVCELHPHLRPAVLDKLLAAMKNPVAAPAVARGIIWILGEYSAAPAEIRNAFTSLVGLLGPFPLRPDLPAAAAGEAEETAPTASLPVVKKTPAVLADGTYATQIAESTVASAGTLGAAGPSVRQLVLGGDYFLGVALCSALTKLAVRLGLIENAPPEVVHKVKAEAMLACASLITYGRFPGAAATIDEGSVARLVSCIRLLNNEISPGMFLASSRDVFVALVADKKRKDQKLAEEQAVKNRVGAEQLIDFEILRSRRIQGGVEDVTGGEGDMASALTGVSSASASAAGGSPSSSAFSLGRVMQLTGMSDPLYAEAHVLVNAYDILLDVTVINKTSKTLQAVTLELATMGDLRLCERPAQLTLAPGDQKSIRANIKVSSSDTGVIFGNLVYDIAGAGGDSGCIILNDIHIDIMDYIRPGEVSDVAFRAMWAEFEWENKVVVNTQITDLAEYLDYILASTNMKCLTLRGMENESGFLAANLYATSVFGEDALVNISAEKAKDGSLAGYVRIRSKTQGIALSLGDKVTLKQASKS
ncbi:Coatomer subunit beta-1 [Porphyridium purpureum]|uniref:Coatomer subunit beta n=1 Tax=Porphyridium purpureum TaxID=35688 RepID=A0A5J4Z7Z2_PORPP|nr:Coatomer subunit beta-1 [Porphyridium purpureum]|eukprot:POR1210..scf295_1